VSRKPRLLDLFCGAGGAAMGYHRAGFEVVGVDIKPQPHYPFEFHQVDALMLMDDLLDGWPIGGFAAGWLLSDFAAIHASPPCKLWTKTGWAYHFDYHANHEDLLTPTRERLRRTALPWVIENVPGAPLIGHIKLCGSLFGLNVRRHRWFELSSEPFDLIHACAHRKGVATPHGHARRAGEGATWGPAMGIDWMTPDEITQAIPPAYTEWIGTQLLQELSPSATELA
jgi:hypothetical protein